MSENCSHECGSCGKDCAERSFLEAPHKLSKVKKVIGVVSGKGGVGKSLVTSLMATAMQQRGYHAAVLDADITGPSIPKIFGAKGRVQGTEDAIFPYRTETGIDIMSLNLLVENETEPVVWRGPVIAGTVKQFWKDVVWENVDYMFVDMPPGTGDVPLTVFQSLPVDGIIIVTSPQELVSMIVEKAVKMANMMDIPILGIVENESYFVCPNCNEKHYIFGESHIDQVAAKYGIAKTVKIPMNPAIARACDAGAIEKLEEKPLEEMAAYLETI